MLWLRSVIFLNLVSFKLFSFKKKSITCMNTLLKVLCVDEYYKSLLGWEEESQSIKLNQIYIKSFTVKIHFCPYLFFFFCAYLLIPRTSREAQGWCIERHQPPSKPSWNSWSWIRNWCRHELNSRPDPAGCKAFFCEAAPIWSIHYARKKSNTQFVWQGKNLE